MRKQFRLSDGNGGKQVCEKETQRNVFAVSTGHIVPEGVQAAAALVGGRAGGGRAGVRARNSLVLSSRQCPAGSVDRARGAGAETPRVRSELVHGSLPGECGFLAAALPPSGEQHREQGWLKWPPSRVGRVRTGATESQSEPQAVFSVFFCAVPRNKQAYVNHLHK